MMTLTICRFSRWLFLLCPLWCLGQTDFTWFETKWTDSYSEWEFFYSWDSTLVAGELTKRWLGTPDKSSWDFRFGEYSGEIEAQSDQSPERWTLRVFGEQIDIQTRWPGYMDAWRLQYRDTTYICSSPDQPYLEVWNCEINDTSSVKIYTEYEGDLRTWLLEEEGKEASPWVKLAMSFVAFMSALGF